MPQNEKQKSDETVTEDQKERRYYYDDAHGYEEYDPDQEDEECDADPDSEPDLE